MLRLPRADQERKTMAVAPHDTRSEDVWGVLSNRVRALRRPGLACFVALLFAVTLWPQTQHSITIGWTYTQGADLATGFNVYRATTSGGPYTKLTATPLSINTLTFMDITGVGGTKYFYVVTAVDIGGFESANSPEASASFLALPLAPVGVTAIAK
jgi:hypothetical protein